MSAKVPGSAKALPEEPSVLGDLISFLGEGARPFSSIKPSMTNHINSRIVNSKLSASCVHANFSHLGIFTLRILCLFECLLKLSKSVYYCLVIVCVNKCE